MKNIIENVKKNENFYIILLISISLIGVALNVSLEANDELWNFQNVYKIYNGFQIYEDANVICTPLFFWLGNIIFNILGANFFVFRIYNILIFLFYYFIAYKILRKLGINIKISTVFILILIIFGKYGLLRVMANYNSLAILLCLLGVYLLIKNNCILDNKNIIIQSIMCFMIILTKQNIGLFYLIALLTLIVIKNDSYKFKQILKIFMILFIFSVIFLIYLKIKGILNGFINYTILGMEQFTTDNISVNWYFIFVGVIILLINLCCSIFILKQKKVLIKKEEKNNILILNCFSIMIFFIIYPIVNLVHFLFAIIIAMILLIYIINIIVKKCGIKLKKIDNIIKSMIIIIVILDIFVNISCFIKWSEEIFSENYCYEYNEPFFGAVVENNLNKNIEKVTNFIQEKKSIGKNTIVFSAKAALYMVPLKESNGFYDLPFNGNFGKLNEEQILDDLKNKEETLILVEKDIEEIEWQENKEIIKAIKEDFKLVGNIEEFEIYVP